MGHVTKARILAGTAVRPLWRYLMRRFIVGLLLLALAATGFAQTTVADYEDAFDDFSSEVANAWTVWKVESWSTA